MTKTIKVWKFGPVETRRIADYLNAVTQEGEKVFGVYPSATTTGSLDVLTYHEKKVPVTKPVTGPSGTASEA